MYWCAFQLQFGRNPISVLVIIKLLKQWWALSFLWGWGDVRVVGGSARWSECAVAARRVLVLAPLSRPHSWPWVGRRRVLIVDKTMYLCRLLVGGLERQPLICVQSRQRDTVMASAWILCPLTNITRYTVWGAYMRHSLIIQIPTSQPFPLLVHLN